MAGRIAAERRKIGFADLVAAKELLAPAEKETMEGFVAYYGAPMIAKDRSSAFWRPSTVPLST